MKAILGHTILLSGEAMSTTKRKKKASKPKVNYELVRSLFKELMSEMDADDECSQELLDKVKAVEKGFFKKAILRDLHTFQKTVAAKLRKTPKGARPNFEHQVGFFLWVAANVPGAEVGLRLLDETEVAPCSFRANLRDYYEDSTHVYN